MLPKIDQGVVIRDDDCWQGFPDTAYFRNKIFVVYRESDYHKPTGSTSLRLVILDDSLKVDQSILIDRTDDRLNCPRLFIMAGELCIICDQVQRSDPANFLKMEDDPTKTTVQLYRSVDGHHWRGPQKTNITGIVPDRVHLTSDNTLLTTTHTKGQNGKLCAQAWVTNHIDSDWLPFPLAKSDKCHFCEGSIAFSKRADEFFPRPRVGLAMCLLRENSGKGLPAYHSISNDSGKKWSVPHRTLLFGCHRPSWGQLKSGNFLVTCRTSFSFAKSCWAKNTVACLIPSRSVLHPATPMQDAEILPLDYDRSVKCDSGYTGWVQLPDGSIFIVNYITDEAPKPYISWYRITERDFHLSD